MSGSGGFNLSSANFIYSLGAIRTQDVPAGTGYDSVSVGFTGTDYSENYTGGLYLYNSEGNLLQSTAVPTTLDLSKVQGGLLNYLATINSYQGHVMFTAELNSISPVPEPLEFTLMLGGLIAVYVLRRRSTLLELMDDNS